MKGLKGAKTPSLHGFGDIYDFQGLLSPTGAEKKYLTKFLNTPLMILIIKQLAALI